MRRLLVLLVLLAQAADLVGAPHASAQSEFDVRGTWRWMRWEMARPTNVKNRGGYGGTLVLSSQDPATGEVTGTLRNGGTYQVTGRVKGSDLSIEVRKRGSPHWTRFEGRLSGSRSNPKWSGRITTNWGARGRFGPSVIAERPIPQSPQGGERRSAVAVMCDQALLAATDDARLECTAQVTDASARPGSVAPSGSVSWTTDVGMIAPATCSLTSSGGSTSWCAVSLVARAGEVPLGTAPPVVASYPGDERYGPSDGRPQLYGTASSYDVTNLYGPGCNPASGPYPSFSCGDPVNPATGNLVMVGVDLVVGGRGPTLGIERTYDSLAAAAGEIGRFGAGWHDLYGARIDIGAGKRRTVVLPGGQSVPFRVSGRRLVGPGWSTATLARTSKGSYRLRLVDGTVYRFDRQGRMTSVTDAAGEAVTLSYDDAGHLASATDGAGRSITFTSDPDGRVIGAVDPAGRQVSYAYSPAGDLVSVTDVTGQVTRYGYDERHRMVSVTDPVGATTTNAYDEQDRVVVQTDALGHTLRFAYEGTFPDVITIATDANGIRTGYESQNGVVIAVTEALDAAVPSVTRYRYDEHSRPVAVVDAGHQTWTSRRDKAGDIVRSSDPLGRVSTLTWDRAHRVTSSTSPMGVTTRIERDQRGLPVRFIEAEGTPDEAVTTFVYADPAHPGDLTSITDPVGATTTFTYDEAGAVATSTDGLGGTTSFTSDASGQLVSVTDPLGVTTSVTRDGRGAVISSTDALGATTFLTRDAIGRMVSLTDAAGRVTSLERDIVGRVTRVGLADGSTLGTTWDPVGARSTQTDALGAVTTTTYDDHGRPASWTDAGGGVWRVTYDAVGRILTSTDPIGTITSYAWDAAGQLRGLAYSDGTPSVTWAYDADGRRVSMTDGTGTTTYAWDARGRPTATTDSAGRTIRYAWDPASRMVGLTYPDGSLVQRAYDPLGRLTMVTDPAAGDNEFRYDAVGNPVELDLANGVKTMLQWDAAGRLTSMDTTTPDGPLLTLRFERDATGRYSAIDEAGVTIPVTHDSVGRLVGLGDQAFAYDIAGSLTELRTETLGYDDGGRLARVSSVDGPTATVGFDPAGRRTSRTADGEAARYTYDGAGRLVGVDDPSSGSSATWSYDGDGLRVGLHDTGLDIDAAFTWGHGSGGPTLLDDGSVRYVQGPGGMPLAQVDRDGVVTWFHGDQSGNIRALSDAAGALVATFEWDAYGLPTSATGTATTRLGFQGGWTDPGNGLQFRIARVYDPVTGQFLSIDPEVIATRQAYGFAAGDPLAFGDPDGTTPVLLGGRAAGQATSAMLDALGWPPPGLTCEMAGESPDGVLDALTGSFGEAAPPAGAGGRVMRSIRQGLVRALGGPSVTGEDPVRDAYPRALQQLIEDMHLNDAHEMLVPQLMDDLYGGGIDYSGLPFGGH